MIKVLSVSGLSKTYDDKPAVDQISFDVHPREIVGLLGPNGAGKTTTINMILGVLAPNSGTIEINGASLSLDRSRALVHTNFAAVYAPLPGNLTVMENLQVFGLLYGVVDLKLRLKELLKQFDRQVSLRHPAHLRQKLLGKNRDVRLLQARSGE